MKLAIAQLGQPVLWQPADDVPAEEIAGAEFQHFLSDMRETLLGQPGVGLAAPQVFSSRRVFLAAVLPPIPMEGVEKPKNEIEVFINPRITEVSSENHAAWEGCLSFPELIVLVERPTAVRVEYLNAQGQAKIMEAAGFAARVIQHEFDHIEGILTLDRIASPRDIIKASEARTLEKQDEAEKDTVEQ
jgi:peptide deformylase